MLVELTDLGNKWYLSRAGLPEGAKKVPEPIRVPRPNLVSGGESAEPRKMSSTQQQAAFFHGRVAWQKGG